MENDDNNKMKLIDDINDCVEKLYQEDGYLFEHDLCERCLMFRTAYYLQKVFEGYYVDCEFNKVGSEKSNTGNKMDIRNNRKMYTDIIVHKRDANQFNNLICLELKRTKRGIDSDKQRLCDITDSNKNYINSKYRLGVLLYLPKVKKDCSILYFENGKQNKNEVLENMCGFENMP